MEAQIEKEEHHEAIGSNNSSQLVTPKFSPVSMSNVNSTETLENLHSCRAQVCDRCRKLKKKCYGTGPSCTNCLVTNNPCSVTTTLKRKRKPKPTKLSPIEVENIKLRLKLQEMENLLKENSSHHAEAMHDSRHSLVKIEDLNSCSLSSSQLNSSNNSVLHSPVSNDDNGTINSYHSKDSRSHSQSELDNDYDTKYNIDCSASLQNNGKIRKRKIQNVISSNFKYLIKTRSLKVDLSMMSSMTKVLLPNEDNYNGPAIIEEYSIVDNFLQQDFIKILKEQKSNISHYLKRFFTEINVLFPIILEKDYMLMKAEELMQSVGVRNFNTNVINDEHNLCIVYKVILISMFYIKDSSVRNGYLKTVKHLLSRFECLDPINTLKCYLLTHLYAQMSNNKPLLVRTNGMISSLAINLRINKFKECNELKRELWYICYCFDFFCNDPNNLDYSLNRYFNDMELVDEVSSQISDENTVDSCEAMRMIHDHSILREMGNSKFLLQVIDVKRAIYSNEITVYAGIKQLLNLSELRKLSHLDDLQNELKESVMAFKKENYQYDFHICFPVLYYMDALICLENSYIKSLMSKVENKVSSRNATISRHLKSLFNYIDTFLRLWTTNIETYDHIPLISVNKLLHYGTFIHWYVTEDDSENQRTKKKSKVNPEVEEKVINMLKMIEDLLLRHTFVDENLKNTKDVITNLIQQLEESKSSDNEEEKEMYSKDFKPFRKITIGDISDDITVSLPLDNKIDTLNQTVEPCELLNDVSDDKSYEQIPLSSYTKLTSNQDVEEQLNNYVSGFTFESSKDNINSVGLVLRSQESETSNRILRHNENSEFFNMTDTVDLKRIHLSTNDFF
ncbi:Zn2/Cys6 DNA-binding domain [Kluyveromyces marxianus]|uniref:Zn2/Cys6 DNA-binding domain n=2 Tax=Kluyveromyces marxianus TaxID=4911 RepID=W0T3Z6_KLUMD|nr:cd12148 domain-containing protein [Kluyveromyces marxianus DMKU3-1042]QGN14062.1 Zn2/Cys6 DNA-binding domain [Kluyveromyces marxianus]BAO37768.1 Zn2/Cys6 DNA-binding domain [Kluyveromyces marxianus DMKU3-1042]BAP69336.1 Zn2/Cys6 DNA-binding domain [Kluyveromyces marxianus]